MCMYHRALDQMIISRNRFFPPLKLNPELVSHMHKLKCILLECVHLYECCVRMKKCSYAVCAYTELWVKSMADISRPLQEVDLNQWQICPLTHVVVSYL